ncbi:MAG: nucleotide exchange factor GrpE [Cytophagales bacterium]|nr:MAG: nucleotide exchange factor GrpE [Rhodothermaeota bacterium MED-G18]|tara:strand:+ start:2271 stop:2750 length:480 start_codon:yes stop_codon:yes gene_type:complete
MNKKKTTKKTKSTKSQDLKLELQESKDKYLRLYSEFENYRRRTSKEKIEMIDSANKDLLKEILPISDDFERAIKSSDPDNPIDGEGINLIFQKLRGILEKHNLKKMEIKVGDDFNSELHEAITSTPSEKKLKGKVVDIIEDGYLIADKILRFGKVVIGS